MPIYTIHTRRPAERITRRTAQLRHLPALLDADGCTLFIGADSEDAIHAVLAQWSKPYVVGVLDPRGKLPADISLPGGTMALIALALDQWGPLP